ncbi:MAG: OB-fold domain-containing protein [Acidimicrobiales bacterium]
MARFEPTATDASDAFWDGTRDEQYLVQWCTGCDVPIFYPREVCPTCLHAEGLAWRPSSGAGTVYAVSIQHRPANPTMADRVPYAVALVELDAGDGSRTIRIMSNVVGDDATTIAVGDAVSLTWEALSDGRNLAVFAPASNGGDHA